MSANRDKQRIVALQKALRVAKTALEQCRYEACGDFVDDALDEINRLDWNSKPDLVLERPRT